MKVVFYGKDLKKDWHLPKRSDMTFQMLGDDRKLPPGTDLLVTIGGDGTFLEALEIVKDTGVPIAGVNFGRLGFLTGCGPDFMGYMFDSVKEKDFSTTNHTVLHLIEEEGSSEMYPYAMNEVCIQRLGSAMLEVDVKMNEKPVATYRGDGIIVATPTGSTAYSLSVGGPIVFPRSGVLVLSPIAPHNLNVRPIVFPDHDLLEIQVKSRVPHAHLHLDNRCRVVNLPYSFQVKKADFHLTSLSFAGNDFITTLREKLMMGFDKRNGGEGYE
ncbi:MAG: hypothetical protein GX877_05630 [Bacteroidales bacterium]|nr:hypothetical protein [Bacteroidales bacterium]